MTDRVLVADDDPDILSVVQVNFELEGFEVETAVDGEDALQKATAVPPNVIVLDIMMPRMDGLTALHRLRGQASTANIPIVLLTARGLPEDRVRGLELGADDYITKPFSIREFRSRIRALLRRAVAPHLARERDDVIERDELRIDIPRRTAEVRGELVQLTFIEFELLVVLASNPGVVFSRRELLERLRGSADYREPRTIDVHVRHLREKIESDPSNPELILTIRGAGYRFRSE